MLFALIGFSIGFFTYDYLLKRKELRLQVELKSKEDNKKFDDLEFLKKKIALKTIQNVEDDIFQSWKDIPGFKAAKMCFEGPAIIGNQSHFVAYVSEFNASTYIIYNKLSSFKITYASLNTSPFDFNYGRIEIYQEGEIILNSIRRDFQHDNADWFQVDFLSREGMNKFLKLIK